MIGDPVHGDEEGFGIMKSRGRTIFEAPASLPRNTIASSVFKSNTCLDAAG